MDSAKLRLMAAAGGALFGLVGALVGGYAIILALTPLLGELWAAVLVGSVFLTAASVCFYVFLLPTRSTEEEAGKVESLAAATLADLPFDAAEQLVRRHPLATVAIALAAGYVLVKDPSKAARHAGHLLHLL